MEETVTYTTYDQDGKLYAVRVLKNAPKEAHDEAQKHLAWKAANSHRRLTGNPFKPLTP